MIKMQMHMVGFLAHPTAFADFDCHGAAHHVTRGQIFRIRGITFHETFTFTIHEIATFATGALGDQATCAVNTCWVELHEFHILKRQSRAGHHATTVTGACMG